VKLEYCSRAARSFDTPRNYRVGDTQKTYMSFKSSFMYLHIFFIFFVSFGSLGCIMPQWWMQFPVAKLITSHVLLNSVQCLVIVWKFSSSFFLHDPAIAQSQS